MRPAGLVFAVLAVVVLVDQASKWWAWRHVGAAMINNGGDQLVGPVVGQWYTDALAGGLLDLFDAGLVVLAVALLLRRPYPPRVLLTGAFMISGWCSNLLDRLGLHYLTAPGSARGAVDFIQIGSMTYNLADFVIIIATPLFLLTVAMTIRRRRVGAPHRAAGTARRSHPVARLAGLAAAVSLIAMVGIGAANSSGMTTPVHLNANGTETVTLGP